ncbi:MAG: aldehyde dehydrogenase family protein [Thermaerobacter sp.]|nr:aldehyde dehydrogenase family protein [Thermaerobacter sp.]
MALAPQTEVWNAWMGGSWTPASSGQSFVVENPANGQVLARVARLSADDVAHAARIARAAFDDGRWSRIAATARGKVLNRLATLLRDHLEEFAQLETRQVGKTLQDSRDEVATAADCFEYYAGAANKIFGRTIPVSAPGLDYTLRVPAGVVGLIVPWNFPFLISVWKIAPALAAGNSLLVKPASYTPLTALLLGPLADAAGIPPGVLNVVPGPGAEVGEALVTDPEVDKIAFTGETATGARIMALAAARIKRVSLELGGKSPIILFDDIDLDRAAYLAVQSAYANSGQDCCARSRVLVQRDILQPFSERYVAHARALTVGDPLDESVAMGPLISAGHRRTVSQYVTRGLEEGARLLLDPAEAAIPAIGYYQGPAVFTDVRPEMAIVREEIFGPVSTLQAFDTEAEAIRLANSTDYGLSGTVFTRDVARALRVANQVRTGVMSVNSIRSVHLEAPFGGFKMSGLGRELGMEALELYTELKNVFVSLE